MHRIMVYRIEIKQQKGVNSSTKKLPTFLLLSPKFTSVPTKKNSVFTLGHAGKKSKTLHTYIYVYIYICVCVNIYNMWICIPSYSPHIVFFLQPKTGMTKKKTHTPHHVTFNQHIIKHVIKITYRFLIGDWLEVLCLFLHTHTREHLT